MNRKIFLCLFVSTFCMAYSFSQSKKDVKNYKIKSITETVTAVENGKEISYNDASTVFDKNGNVIEDINYNKDGIMKKKTTMKYDNFKNKIEELEYEGTNLVKKRQFSYNSNGDKTLEVVYDGSNKLLKKSVYSYNNKGLKVEKKIYDGNNVLLETHKHTYKM